MGEEKDVKFTDLFDPRQPRSDKELYRERMEICKVCPHFNNNRKQCTKCGCFMALKTTLQQAKCPVGKW